MFVYEKWVDGERHLFGNYEGKIPTESDVELTYTDSDGDTIELVEGDKYFDNKKSGIVRLSDEKEVNVFIGEHCIIGNVEPKEIESITVKTAPTKVEYIDGEALDLAGLTIEATYADGDKGTVSDFTTEPAEGSTLAVGTTIVTVTASNKTTTFNVSVREKVSATADSNIASKTWVAGAEEYTEFLVSTVANDDAGIMVIGKSDFGQKYASALESIQYFEIMDSTWKDLPADGKFGPASGFPMQDATSQFRAKFKADTAGDYTFTITIEKVEDGSTLCTNDVAFVVVEA